MAAGIGTRLWSVTGNEIPKPFLEINGISLIERSITKLLDSGIQEIVIVTGHLCHFFENLKSQFKQVKTVKNEQFATTGSMYSFSCAQELIGSQDVFLVEGDLIYEKLAIETLLASNFDNAILLSEDKYYGDDYYYELIGDRIGKMSNDRSDFFGNYAELTGLSKISNALYKKMCKHMISSNKPKIGYEFCLEALAGDSVINYELVEGVIWTEIDDENQLNRVTDKIYPALLAKGEF